MQLHFVFLPKKNLHVSRTGVSISLDQKERFYVDRFWEVFNGSGP